MFPSASERGCRPSSPPSTLTLAEAPPNTPRRQRGARRRPAAGRPAEVRRRQDDTRARRDGRQRAREISSRSRGTLAVSTSAAPCRPASRARWSAPASRNAVSQATEGAVTRHSDGLSRARPEWPGLAGPSGPPLANRGYRAGTHIPSRRGEVGISRGAACRTPRPECDRPGPRSRSPGAEKPSSSARSQSTRSGVRRAVGTTLNATRSGTVWTASVFPDVRMSARPDVEKPAESDGQDRAPRRRPEHLAQPAFEAHEGRETSSAGAALAGHRPVADLVVDERHHVVRQIGHDHPSDLARRCRRAVLRTTLRSARLAVHVEQLGIVRTRLRHVEHFPGRVVIRRPAAERELDRAPVEEGQGLRRR